MCTRVHNTENKDVDDVRQWYPLLVNEINTGTSYLHILLIIRIVVSSIRIITAKRVLVNSPKIYIAVSAKLADLDLDRCSNRKSCQEYDKLTC